MTVVKHKQNMSKRKYDETYFIMYETIVNTAENHFHASKEEYEKHQLFIDDKCREILSLADMVLRYIKVANSIYPQDISEYWKRRDAMNHAIGLCYALLTNYQTVLRVIHAPDDKYITEIDNIMHIINSIRNWRQSDSHFKKELS